MEGEAVLNETRDVLKRGFKTENPEAAKSKVKISDDAVLEALKKIGKPTGTRAIVDMLGIKDPDRGRALVRNAMKRLKDQKKVNMKEEGEKRKHYVYELA